MAVISISADTVFNDCLPQPWCSGCEWYLPAQLLCNVHFRRCSTVSSGGSGDLIRLVAQLLTCTRSHCGVRLDNFQLKFVDIGETANVKKGGNAKQDTLPCQAGASMQVG
jgi:hypothetical protein